MALEGMDVDQVTSIGHQLQHQGDQIDQVISGINGLVSTLTNAWHGQDAVQFEGWWHNQHLPALKLASEAIHGLGQSALNNASAQATTSSPS